MRMPPLIASHPEMQLPVYSPAAPSAALPAAGEECQHCPRHLAVEQRLRRMGLESSHHCECRLDLNRRAAARRAAAQRDAS